jgi:hypothetical protein
MSYDSNLRLVLYVLTVVILLALFLSVTCGLILARSADRPGDRQQQQTIPVKWPKHVRYA